MEEDFTAYLERRRAAQERTAALLCAGQAESRAPAAPVFCGYEELSTHRRIAKAAWPAYCLALCGLSVKRRGAPLCAEAVALLCDWVASGNYVRRGAP